MGRDAGVSAVLATVSLLALPAAAVLMAFEMALDFGFLMVLVMAKMDWIKGL